MTIRKLPEQEQRVETGPTQFGDDWPGIFIRGDNAYFTAHSLRAVVDLLEDIQDDTSRERNDGLLLLQGRGVLDSMIELFTSCVITEPPIEYALLWLRCSKCGRADFDSDSEVDIHKETCKGQLSETPATTT